MNEAEVVQLQMEEPKATVGIYELPRGYLDADGNLHTEVVVHEITGYEEDMLAAPKVSSQKKMNELLTRCVDRIGTITDKDKLTEVVANLGVGDRVFLLFAIRRTSLGEVYPFEEVCPNCGEKKLFQLDLSEMEVKPGESPSQRVFDVTLPSKKTLRFHPMTGMDEAKMSKIAAKNADTLSLAMAMRIDMLNGKPPALNDVKALGLRDRNAFRTAFERAEGGVDTTMEVECPGCEHVFERDVSVGDVGFFFPSRLESSKTKSST
jgi:hypothetical protein